MQSIKIGMHAMSMFASVLILVNSYKMDQKMLEMRIKQTQIDATLNDMHVKVSCINNNSAHIKEEVGEVKHGLMKKKLI